MFSRFNRTPCRLKFPTGLALWSLLVCGAWADDLEVASVIRQVKVFQSGAEVTRSAELTIPAGEHRIIFTQIAPDIDTQRLRLSFADQGLLVGSLQLQELHLGELASDEEQRLQAELEQLRFERREIADRIETANTQLKLLDSLAGGTLGGADASLAAVDLAALLDSLAASANAARQVIREAGREANGKDREIEQKLFELSQVETRQQTQQVLTVAVEASDSTDTSVSVTYPVQQARWTWQYEARLDTQARNLILERKAEVRQTTGEDWTDVAVTITTAQPNRQTATPDLNSLLVDLYSSQARNRQSAAAVAQEFRRDQNDEIEEIIVTGSFVRRSARVASTAYLVEFGIPGLVTIAADSQPRILPIDSRGMPVELFTRTIPERDTTAYLVARFELTEDEPMQYGTMQFYRDGTFIGRREVEEFLPGDEIDLSFGADERVRVERFAEPEESRGGGTFRRAVDDYRVRFRVTSFHDEPINLEVLARVPVPQNDQIEVEIDRDSTEFDEQDYQDRRGVLLWRRQAQPTVPIDINLFYSVAYPSDESLDYEDF